MEMGNLIVKQQEMFEVSCQKNYNSSEGILRVNNEKAENENHIFLSISSIKDLKDFRSNNNSFFGGLIKRKKVKYGNENKFLCSFDKAALCC